MTGHPLESHRALVQDFATHSTARLRDAGANAEVAVAGIITDLKRRRSKKGDWWASFQLEDLEGLVEVMIFPKAYEPFQHVLENDRAVLVTGRVDLEEERARIRADVVQRLDGLLERNAEAVQVRLDAGDLDAGLAGRLRKALEAPSWRQAPLPRDRPDGDLAPAGPSRGRSGRALGAAHPGRGGGRGARTSAVPGPSRALRTSLPDDRMPLSFRARRTERSRVVATTGRSPGHGRSRPGSAR